MKEPISISGWPIKPDSCQVDLGEFISTGWKRSIPSTPVMKTYPKAIHEGLAGLRNSLTQNLFPSGIVASKNRRIEILQNW